jgi:hypothetical protein
LNQNDPGAYASLTIQNLSGSGHKSFGGPRAKPPRKFIKVFFIEIL